MKRIWGAITHSLSDTTLIDHLVMREFVSGDLTGGYPKGHIPMVIWASVVKARPGWTVRCEAAGLQASVNNGCLPSDTALTDSSECSWISSAFVRSVLVCMWIGSVLVCACVSWGIVCFYGLQVHAVEERVKGESKEGQKKVKGESKGGLRGRHVNQHHKTRGKVGENARDWREKKGVGP